ncbi:tyrosine-type recombinase/integrase [Catenuloplanes japonicus]|uniref:tyrosine-type recombinase/integrase n=1 Tax=Catenuloplanes japonicus TaxID=33876 RepID=UPI00068DD73F|nr:tyrosine-type recombinase/integrase [Catenuloplanes japonicus]
MSPDSLTNVEIGTVVPAARRALEAGGGAATEFTDAWLANRRLSDHTRAAYKRDITGWLAWCDTHAISPLTVTFLQVNAYARELETTLADTTVARKLSAMSSWYDFLTRLQAVPANPVSGADRPHVDRDHSGTVGLTPAEVDALIAAAESATGPTADRTRAVIALLADLGLRVSELCGLDVTDLGYERGHRAVRFTGKGGKARRRALAPGTAAAVDAYLQSRGTPLDGPLLVTAGGGRLDRHAVFRLVRQLARDAGIPAWEQLSPHSLRHAFATTARAEGVPLEDVQDAMGHADPRTTRRYDRDRHNLDRDPAYAIWAARARRGGGRQ